LNFSFIFLDDGKGKKFLQIVEKFNYKCYFKKDAFYIG